MLIGIDLGTSTCKVIAVNGDGEVVAKQSRDYAMINLRQGWAEQDPAEWWRATDEAIAALTAALPEGGREVSGIGCAARCTGSPPSTPLANRCGTRSCGTTSGPPRSATGSPNGQAGSTSSCG
nr:FGGY family carbohydrate kinase [Saccharopolyspora karakumensis]